ncbi:probable pre-mRNA-splicing factor ATP-dependent RNA helicase DEAH4 [Tanacetum coccineum]
MSHHLPILQFEEKIITTVNENPVVVIISQIFLRNSYTKSGIIAVTQPRRVAAVSVSRYVIDSGYVKQRQYNPSTRMYSLDVVEISRVQANQRAGRAGRTRPGKCYRLYPLAVYHDNLLEATVPEIQ